MSSKTPSNSACRTVTACRVCGGKDLVQFLNLGEMPLANRHLGSAEEAGEPRFPLEINLCRSCCQSQLSVVVDPEVLYSDYNYHSSVSMTFQQHCEAMAKELDRILGLGKDDLVLEIASNDGCMLAKFKKLGCRILGVEPAANLAQLAENMGLPTLNSFWSDAAADQVKREHGGAKLVVATNVLAHVDDLHGFMSAVKKVLVPSGAFVFEVPYMVHFINRAEFDTTYHEHLSYFLLRPLKVALEKNGFMIQDAKEQDIHGGSIRVIARLAASGAVAPSEDVKRLLAWEEELGLYDERTYHRFASQVAMVKEELTLFLTALKARGKTLAAYGASAKGNVLLNYSGVGRELLEYVVDDTPAKQGKFYAGNRLPIVSRAQLRTAPPDYLLLLAWNFVDEMVGNTVDFRQRGGRYVVPIPSLRVM